MGKPNQTSPGPLVQPSGKITGTQDFSRESIGSPVSMPGERGTRKLKVFDGAMIEQLLGTRTGY